MAISAHEDPIDSDATTGATAGQEAPDALVRVDERGDPPHQLRVGHPRREADRRLRRQAPPRLTGPQFATAAPPLCSDASPKMTARGHPEAVTRPARSRP